MLKIFLTRGVLKSILCYLFLLVFVLPVHAARVGFLQQNTAWNNINHLNSITTGNAQDRRNSAQINQLIGNHQTHLIYSVKTHTTPLKDELNIILQRVFTAPSVVS